jgi:hypothetical protein
MIRLLCTYCGHKLLVAPEDGNRPAQCPHCGKASLVPAASATVDYVPDMAATLAGSTPEPGGTAPDAGGPRPARGTARRRSASSGRRGQRRGCTTPTSCRAGYRRYEWKCDALNAASRAAAQRLGLSFERVFRQATVSKGRNRDTAWYAAIDREWPALREAFLAWLDPGNFDGDGRQRTRLSDRTRPLLEQRG